MYDKINIYGASGHAKVVAELAKLNGLEIHQVVDDNPKIESFLGIQVNHSISDSPYSWIVSIGHNHFRMSISKLISGPFAQLFHPSAIISQEATIGMGTVAMAGVTINPYANIGDHVILNTQCTVDHDCRVGDFVHLSPNVTLCGAVEIGNGSHIGAAAVIIPGVKVGENCIVGAGSVVIRDIPNGSKVVGNPGRIISQEAVVKYDDLRF